MKLEIIKNLIIKKKFLITLFVLWTLMTLYLTLLPSKDIGHFRIYHYDKIGHAGMFMGWTYLLGLSLHIRDKLTLPNIIITCSAGALFGGLVEILQAIMPFHRDPDIHDFYADVIGCLIAFYLLILTKKKLKKEESATT